MTRKGGVGSPPQGPAILFLFFLHRPLLPSPLDAPPAPFPAPLPKCWEQTTQEERAGKWKTAGHGARGKQLRN